MIVWDRTCMSRYDGCHFAGASSPTVRSILQITPSPRRSFTLGILRACPLHAACPTSLHVVRVSSPVVRCRWRWRVASASAGVAARAAASGTLARLRAAPHAHQTSDSYRAHRSRRDCRWWCFTFARPRHHRRCECASSPSYGLLASGPRAGRLPGTPTAERLTGDTAHAQVDDAEGEKWRMR